MDLNQAMARDAALTEEALQKYMADLSVGAAEAEVLKDAMSYSLMIGGKRIRPFLVLEFCRMICGGRVTDGEIMAAALPFACAVECIHTYSLIHDDLPCMDDDDMRRGHPSNHKVYGEATALLAGDALLTAAFGIAAKNEAVDAGTALAVVRLLSECAGAVGMCGGQQIDLAGEKQELSFETLLTLHEKKTGALIRYCCLAGTMAGLALLWKHGIDDVDEAAMMEAAETYAAGVGTTFQIVDDILDRIGDPETLGKAVGVDSEHHKTTFMTFMTVEEGYAYAERLTEEAVKAVDGIMGSVLPVEFARYLLRRKH